MLKFEPFEIRDSQDYPEPGPNRRAPQVQCPCGRFAKYLRGEAYYNGTWNCYRFYTMCTRCGEQTTECV